jgi:amidase
MPVSFVGPLRVGPEILASGAAGGPLSGVTLAVKDVIDVAGVATGAGNPAFLADAEPAREHAAAVSLLLEAGADVIGKAHTDELAFSLSGTNVHYGTPRNPAAPGRVPGGSSSGSASTVAAGTAQIALGTDTAGSIRVPASYCGAYGLRPSHARVPLARVLPLAPSFDTCGVVAASGELLEQAGLCLLGSQPSGPPQVLVLASDLLAEADAPVAAAVQRAADRLAGLLGVPLRPAELARDRLDRWLAAFRGRQLVEAWRAHGEWITTRRPPLGPGVAARFAAAEAAPERDACAAPAAHAEVLAALERVLPAAGALVLPSTATTAPLPELPEAEKEDLRRRTMRLTCLAGLAGAPAVSLPLADCAGLPVGLCLLARPGEDERLLAAARLS